MYKSMEKCILAIRVLMVWVDWEKDWAGRVPRIDEVVREDVLMAVEKLRS